MPRFLDICGFYITTNAEQAVLRGLNQREGTNRISKKYSPST